MPRFVAVLALLLILPACSLRTVPESTVTHVGGPLTKAQMGAVVYLSRTTPKGDAFCSGFYISPTIVMTAAHCGREGVAIRNGENVNSLEEVYRDQTHDVMLYRASEASSTYLRMAVSLAADQDVWIYSRGSEDGGIIMRTTVLSPEMLGRPSVAFNRSFIEGQSGSPAVDQDGRVVSVVQSSNIFVGFGAHLSTVEAAYAKAHELEGL